MGMTAGFTLLSADQFARLRADPNADIQHDPRVSFFLEKSWSLFHSLFQERGEPLASVFKGDYTPDGSWGEYVEETHFGYISPAMAEAVCGRLEEIDPEDLFDQAAETGWAVDPERERGYRDFYHELRVAFRVARRCGGGLSVCIS